MKTAEDEATRRAAWEGLRSIGQFILDNKFLDVVKGRNQVAKRLGYKDFFDYKSVSSLCCRLAIESTCRGVEHCRARSRSLSLSLSLSRGCRGAQHV
jgi:hypothetical protein